jgi:molybdate transport system regulatory protein
MSLSIRNRLPGTVTSVSPGKVMATVKSRLPGGQEVTAAITREAVEELGIAEGSSVAVLMKATEVSLATAPVAGISIRNQLRGEVTEVASGDAMATVKIAVDGSTLTAAVTAEAVTELGLSTGSQVVALIKSTEIALATN